MQREMPVSTCARHFVLSYTMPDAISELPVFLVGLCSFGGALPSQGSQAMPRIISIEGRVHCSIGLPTIPTHPTTPRMARYLSQRCRIFVSSASHPHALAAFSGIPLYPAPYGSKLTKPTHLPSPTSCAFRALLVAQSFRPADHRRIAQFIAAVAGFRTSGETNGRCVHCRLRPLKQNEDAQVDTFVGSGGD